jgi:peptide/nickel transport system permease protein
MLSIRGMMVTTMGADYLNLARAKGLTERRIFFRYTLRNALLPQVTSLVLALGHIVSGAILIEVIFSLPGIGHLLYRSIGFLDYPMIQGITFILVVSVALSVLVLDLLYPKLDPRITYARR